MADAFEVATSEINETMVYNPLTDRKESALEIHFTETKNFIKGFSSNPDAMRGEGGEVGIDELTSHAQPEELVKAAGGRAMWGYPVRIWTSHRGVDSCFNRMIQEERVFYRNPKNLTLMWVPGEAGIRRDGPTQEELDRIEIEAIPLDEKRAFLHFSYAYSYGMASKLALRAYLMTAGRDKVGFSVVKREANGQPQYVSGSRATVERNTMRYYLAIDAYLSGLEAPAGERLEKRLTAWYGATEQYPRQLHEVSREDYLSMKRKEVARQQKAAQ